jgi:hypothetical protein
MPNLFCYSYLGDFTYMFVYLLKGVKIMEEEEFKEKLRKLLMDFDIQSREYPDPVHVGYALWEYYLAKVEMPHIASDKIRTYFSDLCDAKREKESKREK